MAYIPSVYSLKLSTEEEVQWLLGVPITDKEIGATSNEIAEKARSIYPEWLFHTSA